MINSYIGIRQELKAKRTLDELAVLVAPHARVVRDGETAKLLATEVVPGDVVHVEPGDQLVADGEVIRTRGMTLDESMLTGEADGVRKGLGERALSGSFCISGSGYYVVDAVREESYAGRLAGEAKAFRHPPSPLQDEVNRVIVACTYADGAAGGDPDPGAEGAQAPDRRSAAQTATAGLVTLIPEGLVLLMSVTFAVAAVRLARRDTLVQQMSATESLASVDTICVDKTGTLTDGELRLLGVEVAEGVEEAAAHAALGRFAASAGERNRTLEAIAERFPGKPGRVGAEVPFSSEWKWSGLTTGSTTYVLGAPDVLAEAGALTLPPGLARKLEEETAAGRRVVAFGETEGGAARRTLRRRRRRGSRPLALVVLEETLRPDAAETIAVMREEDVDLKLISGDARATVTAVAYAVGVPRDAGVIEGPELPEDPEELAEAAQRNTIFCRIKPEQKKALVGGALGGGALHGDDRRRRQRRAGAEAGADGGGDGVGGAGDQGRGRRGAARGRVRATAAGGRRGTADRPQHPPARAAVSDQDGLRGDADPAGRGAGVRLPLPPPPPHPGRLADDRHPLLRPRPGALRRAAVPGAAAARARRPSRSRPGWPPRSARSSPSSSSTPSSAAASKPGAPRRRRP